MIKIAHRGNIEGPSEKENSPEHIKKAITLGFDAEIDVWLVGKKLWLGHDMPQYILSKNFLDKHKSNLWIHCKNLAALEYFVKTKEEYVYFWHEEDDYTLTSNHFIWTYPGKKVTSNSIIVIKDKFVPEEALDVAGICSDYVGLIKNIYGQEDLFRL
jgi:hypothetical protein